MAHTGLVVEKRFSEVARVGVLLGEEMDEIGIVEVNLVDLPESPDAAGGVAELSDEACFFDVEKVVGKIVAAHANHVR